MRPKANKKEVWKSLVRASSSEQPTEEKKEEEEAYIITYTRYIYETITEFRFIRQKF